MAARAARPYSEPLKLLWSAGTCAGLSDGRLLAQFLAGRDEAGELAFEVLVKRHGPMVLRVCHQVLDDPGDIHDAWQAVFLVLARRAGAIRNRESLAAWLHGVAFRLAKRSRMTASRRWLRDHRTVSAAESRAREAIAPRQVESSEIERQELAGIVQAEITRLPEKFRAPIVLCYMEGLTHDEAAAALNWPVGTVRSRLSRGRDTLHRRLQARGMTSPESLTPLPALPAVGSATAIPEYVAKLVARLASQATGGPLSVATPLNVTSLALAEEVLKMMTFKKVMVLTALFLSLATFTIGGGIAAVRASRASNEQTAPASAQQENPAQPKAAVRLAEADVIDPQLQQMLELAKSQYDSALRLYQNAQTEYKVVIEAGLQLDDFELRAANTPAARHAVKERSVQRLQLLENVTEARVRAARSSNVELIAVKLQRMQAEMNLKTPDDENPDPAAMLRRLKQLETKVEQLEKRLPRG